MSTQLPRWMALLNQFADTRQLASLSALQGFQPELDRNPSLYDAISYDDECKSIADFIRPTNFPGLDIVAGNLELQEYEYDTPLAMQSGTEGKRFFTRLGKSLEEVIVAMTSWS